MATEEENEDTDQNTLAPNQDAMDPRMQSLANHDRALEQHPQSVNSEMTFAAL